MSKKAKEISKEKSDLIIELKAKGEPNPYSLAGKMINDKYGIGWRERFLINTIEK